MEVEDWCIGPARMGILTGTNAINTGGSTFCLKPDGTYGPCIITFPSQADIDKAKSGGGNTNKSATSKIVVMSHRRNAMETSGNPDAQGNLTLNWTPDATTSYYLEYTPEAPSGNNGTAKNGQVVPIRMELPDFEKGWVLENNQPSGKRISLTKKVGDAVLTVTYFKGGVKVNVRKG